MLPTREQAAGFPGITCRHRASVGGGKDIAEGCRRAGAGWKFRKQGRGGGTLSRSWQVGRERFPPRVLGGKQVGRRRASERWRAWSRLSPPAPPSPNSRAHPRTRWRRATKRIPTFATGALLLVASSRRLAVALPAAVGMKTGEPGSLPAALPAPPAGAEAAPAPGPGRAGGLPPGLAPARGRWRMPSSRRTSRILAGSSSTLQPTKMRHSGQRSSWREHTMLSRQRRQKVC